MFIGNYLLVSRDGHEIVDLVYPNAKYQLLAENVPRVGGATGGILQNSPIICGGFDDNDMFTSSKDCFVIGQPEMKIKMIKKRNYAASVTSNPSRLWIVGCENENGFLSSTEFIKLGQHSVKGPDLPFTISCHCMIQYNEKSIYIIGGYQNGSYSRKTWIVDPTNGFKLVEGPSLNERRAVHGCAKMTINGRTILVAAGGEGEKDFKTLDSVEILDPSENNIWTPGLFLKLIL